ncbi:hypothetical protein XFF6991_430067 [Xanthomonas phaseoli pv. phaseoli]|uniref:Uncharacterized protein n=1 Tax=Xanthomonas campestris pv. phaseoli TaxID=317013 RepID=A0A7Z7J3X9_XANCH|nr:hypothetical protein XFF6991_430067 [Xanthomonas phaseoli pv. phaseoli]
MRRRAAIEHAGQSSVPNLPVWWISSALPFPSFGDANVKALLGPGWRDVGLFGQLLFRWPVAV